MRINNFNLLLHIKNLKKILLTYCFTLLLNFAQAQSVDLFFGAASSHFLGDLGGKPFAGTNDFQDVDFAKTRYGLTTGLRLNLGSRFAFRLNGWYARVAGDDKYTKNKERRGRNLNFYSHILEGDLTAELNILKSKNGKGNFYIFGGIGFFTFNPKTKLNGTVYELRDYGTEGQYTVNAKSPYALSSISFPMGIGYKLYIGRKSYLTFELNGRKTQTDYIDDVSTNFVDPALLVASKGPVAAQLADRNISDIPGFSSPGSIRGDPKNNDSFFFFCISYNIMLGKGEGGSGYGGSRRGGKIHGKRKCFEF